MHVISVDSTFLKLEFSHSIHSCFASQTFLTPSITSEMFDNLIRQHSGFKRKCRVSVCVSFLTPSAAPVQDSSSLERRNPISLNSHRAAQKDIEVLHSNFTAINPHRCEGAGGSGWWQPDGEEIGSGSGCIPFLFFIQSSPIYCSLLSHPLKQAHREVVFCYWSHRLKSLFTF